MTKFCHTHVHTGYSLLDSMVRIEPLVRAVKDFGHTACSITDHGNLAGVVKFTDACKKAGIKPILGEEFYIAPDSRHRKKYAKGEHYASHLILLAKTDKGWDNLRTLSTLAYTEGFYRKPRIDHELLARYSEGLICTTACMGSDISVHLKTGFDADGEGKVTFDPELAAAKMAWYGSVFGADFYIELQDHGPHSAQAGINEWYRERYPAEQTIATADCHYLTAEDYDTHDTLLCCNTLGPHSIGNKYMEDRWRFPTDQCWLKSTEEMLERFPEHELENTQKIADSVEFELPLRKQFFMPELPADITEQGTPEEIFRRECWNGLCERFQIFNEEDMAELTSLGYDARLEYEMQVFVEAGFVEYALVLWDLMRFCRENEIFTGDGRGSAAGSLVMFALGIVNVDPIARNCPFERFINPGRIANFSPPDVDLDFPRSRRGEVLEYLRWRYGEDRVCQIGTYSTFGAAKLVQKIGGVLGVDQGVMRRISDIIPTGESSSQGAGPASEAHGLSLDEVWQQSDEFRKIIETLGDTGSWMLHYARGLQSLGTHASTHASGVIIASRPVAELMPLMIAKDVTLAQLDMFDAEAVGLIKFDILGLETLDILADVQRAVRATIDPDFSFERIDLDDPAAMNLLSSGRTMGIFQASGGGFGRLLPQAKPRTVEDLAVLTSLCRPGPVLSGDTERYLKRRQGSEAITYEINELEPILGSNMGVLAFQEDIMAIAAELAGFSMAEADELRKVMGKKQVEKMPHYREKFLLGLEEHGGISSQAGDKLWSMMLPMAQYVFNRSHAMAYSYLTSKTAYAKAHFPAYFLASAMTADVTGGDGGDLPALVRDAQMAGCRFVPPSINLSGAGYTALNPETILLGLSCVRGVGPAAATAILEERTARGEFANAEDLRARIAPRSVNAGHIKALERAGAFAGLINEAPDKPGKSINEDDRECFTDGASMRPFLSLEEELEMYGFYLSGHPCRHHRHEWDSEHLSTLLEIENDFRRSASIRYTKYGRKRVWVFAEHRIRVVVSKIDRRKSKKTHGFMWMLDLEDETGQMKAIINSGQMEKFGNVPIKKGSILELVGRKGDPDRWAGYFDISSLKIWE